MLHDSALRFRNTRASKFALDVVSKHGVCCDEWVTGNTFDEIKGRFAKFKTEIQVTACDECKTNDTGRSAGTSMSSRWSGLVGEQFTKDDLMSYSMPTLDIRARLWPSAYQDESRHETPQ